MSDWRDLVLENNYKASMKSWVEKFLKHWKPNLAIMMESEIWPNFIFCCSSIFLLER